MEVRPVQPEKAPYPMLVTPSPNTTSFMEEFPPNQLPTFAQLIVTCSKLLQPENASLPMLVTPLGMTMEVRPSQFEKA